MNESKKKQLFIALSSVGLVALVAFIFFGVESGSIDEQALTAQASNATTGTNTGGDNTDAPKIFIPSSNTNTTSTTTSTGTTGSSTGTQTRRQQEYSAFFNSTETLEYGSEGSIVMDFQRFLNNEFGGTLKVDGKWGPATDKAVRALQSAAGITVDGKVGTQTRTQLATCCENFTFNPALPGAQQTTSTSTQTSTATTTGGEQTTATPTTITPSIFNGNGYDISIDTSMYPNLLTRTQTLRPGMTGQSVIELQKFLNDHLDTRIPETGTYDQATRAALAYFQVPNGLESDGVLGSATLSALRNVVGQNYNTSLGTPYQQFCRTHSGTYSVQYHNNQAGRVQSAHCYINHYWQYHWTWK